MSYFDASATCAFWYFVIALLFWRFLMGFPKIQQRIHSIGPDQRFAMVVQWYNFWFAGIPVIIVYSLLEFFYQYKSASPKEVEETLKNVFESNNKTELAQYFDSSGIPVHKPNALSFDEFKQLLWVQPWLKNLNIVALFTAPVTVVVAAYHIYKILVIPGHNHSLTVRERATVSWMPFKRMKFLMLIFVMPTVYVVSCLRANVRLWALFTGKMNGATHESWEHIHRMELSMYINDMEVANFMQFFAVYAFARLCGLFISEHAKSDGVNNGGMSGQFEQGRTVSVAKELQMIIRWPAFLGVWAFFAVGVLESLLTFVVAELMQNDQYMDVACKVEDKVLPALAPVLGTLTILAVINMIMISNMNMVKEKLGNANMKFNGTRLLILVSTIQEKVISVFTLGSNLYGVFYKNRERVDEILGDYFTSRQLKVSKWQFSREKGYLLHVSLLLFESLFVVLWNLWFWRDFNLHKNVLDVPPDHETRELLGEHRMYKADDDLDDEDAQLRLVPGPGRGGERSGEAEKDEEGGERTQGGGFFLCCVRPGEARNADL